MHQPPVPHVASEDPEVAELINSEAQRQFDDEATIERIAGEVRELLAGFPMPGWSAG